MVYTLFVVLIVLVSIMMILIVLIQESKGGGLASNFSSSNSIMGVRKTTDFIENATWGLAACMVVLSVLCTYVAPTSSADQSVLEKSATQTETTNPANVPGFGAGQQAAPKGQQTAPQGAAKKAPAAPKAPATPAN